MAWRVSLPPRRRPVSERASERGIYPFVPLNPLTTPTIANARRSCSRRRTNIRLTPPTVPPPSSPPSRGTLLKSFLTSATPLREFIEALQPRAGGYEGFNLLVLDLQRGETGYVTNRPEATATVLTPSTSRGEGERTSVDGVRGLSNSPIWSPWEKVRSGEERMEAALAAWQSDGGGLDDLVDGMFGVLQYVPSLSLPT